MMYTFGGISNDWKLRRNNKGVFGLALIIILLLAPFIYFALVLSFRYNIYRKSQYGYVSGNSFFRTVFDKGNFGEFLTFTYLEKLEGHNRLLTNLYLPKEDGTTTEIDLIMISQTGIYVFESKNYSGWIFGDENSKHWTQSLKNNIKNKFYNPIWQNKGHINALKNALGIDNLNLFKSYIVFSERCSLKKINITSPNIKVVKRDLLLRTIRHEIKNSNELLTREEVDKIYIKLLKFVSLDDEIKIRHIENIKSRVS